MPSRVHRIVAAALAIVAAAAAGASAELTVKGDAAAWPEVTEAYAKLNALPGYRMKMITGAQTMIIEVAPAGGAMHMTMQGTGGGMETLMAGGQVRYRVNAQGAPAAWMCQGVPPVPRVGDPTAVQGTVEITRGPDTAIDGQAARAYVYTIQTAAGGQSANVKTTLYVTTGNGLPRRMVIGAPVDLLLSKNQADRKARTREELEARDRGHDYPLPHNNLLCIASTAAWARFA